MNPQKKRSIPGYSGDDYVFKDNKLSLPHHVLLHSLQNVYEQAISQLKPPRILTPELFAGGALSSFISAIIAISETDSYSWYVATPHILVGVVCVVLGLFLYCFKLLDISKLDRDHKLRDRCIKKEIDRLYRDSSPLNPAQKHSKDKS